MKKNVLVFMLIIFLGVAAHSQVGQSQNGPIDVILLLDTSTGMSSSYDNVNNYITGGFLREFLRIGDTFHLIAFSQTPRLDVARRIAAMGDVRTITARMMLQYRIERGSNIAGAITYAEQYIAGLPVRPKKIVLVSTGGSDTANLVSSANQRLSSRNATIDFVQVTPGQAITNTPRSGRPPAAQRTGDGTGTTSTTTTTTAPPAVTPPRASDTPPVIPPAADRFGTLDTPSMSGDTADVRSTDSTGTAADKDSAGKIAEESNTVPASGDDIATTFTDERVSDTGVTPAVKKEKIGFSLDSSSLPWIIGIALLLLLIIGLIVFLSSRKLGSSPNRVMAEAASSKSDSVKSDSMERFADHSKDLARYAAGQSRRTTPYSDRPPRPAAAAPVVINPQGPLLLNLYVEDQNTSIGKRNIHSLKSGYSLSVGGAKTDGFLIFLVPMPANIGELRRNGSQLSFIPKKAKYFPDLGSNELRDCLNKTIRVISDKNYELRIRFEMYENPLASLNRMLNSIKVPG